MTANFFFLFGGVGMFLMGMEAMTRALKELAGSNLRAVLARFTTTPLRGVASGAAVTALVQSSSATTVMTVGFVGAGLISLPQAMGILFGANIGTTANGWLVSILGMKLQLGSLAMAALLPASLSTLLGRGAFARAGQVAAGLCLLLSGLELMQTAMEAATGLLRPEMLPQHGVLGMLGLMLIGLVMTVIVQSSGAMVALALVLLQGGAIGLEQAAAMVLGMNIGTTFTALLASVGGSRPMRQAAVANLAFNVITTALAFPLLMLLAPGLLRLGATIGPLNTLLCFHTGFNLAGAALFLPVTTRFAELIERLVPEREADRLRLGLDRALLSDARAALVAAQGGAAVIAGRLFSALAAAMRPEPDYRKLAALAPVMPDALDRLERYLAAIRLPADLRAEEEAYSALLHEADHLRRLLERAEQHGNIQTLFEDRSLRRPAALMGALLGRVAEAGSDRDPARFAWLEEIVDHRAARHRRGLLLGEHAGLYSLAEVFAHTDAMRWLQRSLHHAARISHYDQVARRGVLQQPPPAG
ncbi:Na/Pi cotransporter family protein [Pseudodonghicola flavimaris]|uniref:Na/Pi symporter n=1 Tax=Pseudodonghicola flavimaris TaxID=3050036 RepID=A0ABT7EWH1_9RHOB|nr:Na/Pi symporter [Pseudodonghicola flavimaris]MDK3016686.1 Na/Pi symporter [Pseudodonghicola flavimaris]